MRKAINGTLKILTISSVIVSMLLILVAYCTQYSIKEKSDLKSRTNILAQCLDAVSYTHLTLPTKRIV